MNVQFFFIYYFLRNFIVILFYFNQQKNGRKIYISISQKEGEKNGWFPVQQCSNTLN
jgi:hypothetical protein